MLQMIDYLTLLKSYPGLPSHPQLSGR